MPAKVITQVTLENFHELITEYIHNKNIIISNYDDMKETYLCMLRDQYLFTFDRDVLIACLTDLTYMYAPGDDLNKDAVIELLVLENEDGCDEGSEDEDEDDDDEDGVNRTIHFPPGVDSSLEPREVQTDTDECSSGM
jgi:hypothetical protein